MSLHFRNIFALPWLALALCLFLAPFVGRLGESGASLIFLSSILLFGLPHGACDLAYPGWCLGRPLGRLAVVRLIVFYVAAMILVGLGWWLYPGASAVAFLLVTAWHWGSADASVLFPTGKGWAVFAAGRGLFVMGAPFAFQGAATEKFLAPFLRVGTSEPFAAGLVVAAIATQLVAVAATAPRDQSLWLKVVLEIGALLFLFAWLHPLVSIGIYFIFFHAWRHIQRLCDLRGTVGFFPRLMDFHRQALPLTIVALVGSLILYGCWKKGALLAGPNPAQEAQAYFVILSMLTLPHALIVLWSDLRGVPTGPFPRSASAMSSAF